MPDAARPHKAREMAVVTGLGVAAIAGMAAAVYYVLPGLPYAESRPGLLFAAVAALAITQLLSFDLDLLRWVTRDEEGQTRYEQLRRWTRLKASVLLLTLLVLWAALVLSGALAVRIGLLNADLDGRTMQRMLSVNVLGLTLTAAYAHYQSLRIKVDHDRNSMRRSFNALGSGLGLAIAVTALIVAASGRLGPFGPGDDSFLAVAALATLGVTLFVTRSLPTPYGIFGNENRYHGAVHFSRSKSVALPTAIAFGLLFLLLLMLLVVGFGATARVGRVFESRAALAALAALGLAGILSVVASLMLARQEDKMVLIQKHKSREQKTAQAVAWTSGSVATLLFVGAYLLSQRDLWGLSSSSWTHLLTFGLLALVGPIGFYKGHRARRIRQIEARFPDFLRDIASSHKGGLTLPGAVYVAAKGDYGALTPDVQRFADQLSWNVAFDEALMRFGERVQTPVVERTVGLILAASRSGGNTTDVLLAAGRDAREIKNLESQRRMSMSLYTAVIYITFGVFLVVVAIMSSQFVPEIIAASEAALEQGVTGVGGVSFDTPSAEQFRTFYYLAAVVQGLGDGIVAGLMGSGRFSLGLRHSFLMVLLAYLTFTFWL